MKATCFALVCLMMLNVVQPNYGNPVVCDDKIVLGKAIDYAVKQVNEKNGTSYEVKTGPEKCDVTLNQGKATAKASAQLIDKSTGRTVYCDFTVCQTLNNMTFSTKSLKCDPA